MSFPAQTTGVGVPAKILVEGNVPPVLSTIPGKNNVVISLSGANSQPTSFQLNPEIVDVNDDPVDLGATFTLTAVANASGGTAVYTGTITGGASNAFAGKTFDVAGFTTDANNGVFIATASSATTLTLENGAAVAETHAATAKAQESINNLTYFASGTASYTGGTSPVSGTRENVVTVSSTGNITTNGVTGGAVVEVSFPSFNNAEGTTGAISPNPMTGLPKDKIYAEVNVTVVD